MTTTTPTRPTLRQLRLLAWMRDPPTTALPDHPAIVRTAAAWSAAELVEHAGVYESRRACLTDLGRLADGGHVRRLGNRWQLGDRAG